MGSSDLTTTCRQGRDGSRQASRRAARHGRRDRAAARRTAAADRPGIPGRTAFGARRRGRPPDRRVLRRHAAADHGAGERRQPRPRLPRPARRGAFAEVVQRHSRRAVAVGGRQTHRDGRAPAVTRTPRRGGGPGGQRVPPRPPATARNPAQRSRFRSEEHTSELQSLMRISYAVFCLKIKNTFALIYKPIEENTHSLIFYLHFTLPAVITLCNQYHFTIPLHSVINLFNHQVLLHRYYSLD